MADDPDSFYSRVYDLVRQIPPGRVTTYGHVARALGTPRASRGVGWALRAVAASGSGGPLAVPCHRVVNREGQLTGRLHFETPTVMEERLRAEGVPATSDRVDLGRHFWDPAGADPPTPRLAATAAAGRQGRDVQGVGGTPA